MEGTKGIRVKLRNNNQSLIRVESVMSPAGGGAGGGLDNPIASTYHLFNPLYNTAHILQYIFPQASLCFRHFLTQVVCKWLQPFVVGVIIDFIGFWFFPHCFRVPFPPPAPPPAGDSHPLDPPPAGDSYLPRFPWILCRCVSP